MRHSNGKRSRGRSGRRGGSSGGGGGGNNPNRAYDSNGPNGKLRGTATQLVEKYTAMARDARVGRDRVLVENYFQHAEHYQRLVNELQAAQDAQQAAREEQPRVEAKTEAPAPNETNGGPGAQEQPVIETPVVEAPVVETPPVEAAVEARAPKPKPRRRRAAPKAEAENKDAEKPEAAEEAPAEV